MEEPPLTVTDQELDQLIHAFAGAEMMTAMPGVVDVFRSPPPNPPASVQIAFVGSENLQAFAEGASFVRVADEWSRRHGNDGLASARRIIDFGSGWGRIARCLLAYVEPSHLYAVDVDIEMTALLNTTLPGINAMTVDPQPPTVMRDAVVDAVVAFSVFSHLEPETHRAWAEEFGRLIVPGGMASITLLDAVFFDQLQGAKNALAGGDTSHFTTALASVITDLDAARAAYDNGRPVYAGTGGGGVRTGDYYGWAAIPPAFIKDVWGAAGFDVVEWTPSGVLFGQAMVGLKRR
jgi:hypothetical protein